MVRCRYTASLFGEPMCSSRAEPRFLPRKIAGVFGVRAPLIGGANERAARVLQAPKMPARKTSGCRHRRCAGARSARFRASGRVDPNKCEGGRASQEALLSLAWIATIIRLPHLFLFFPAVSSHSDEVTQDLPQIRFQRRLYVELAELLRELLPQVRYSFSGLLPTPCSEISGMAALQKTVRRGATNTVRDCTKARPGSGRV